MKNFHICKAQKDAADNRPQQYKSDEMNPR